MDAQTLATMQMIIHIILLSFYGFLLALFSYFLDFCFWKKNIFQFWLPFLSRKVAEFFFPIKYDNIMMIKDKEKRQDQLFELVNDHPLFKMLGGCAICLNVWIGILTAPIIFNYTNSLVTFDISTFWMISFKTGVFIYYIVFSNFILRKIMKVD